MKEIVDWLMIPLDGMVERDAIKCSPSDLLADDVITLRAWPGKTWRVAGLPDRYEGSWRIYVHAEVFKGE